MRTPLPRRVATSADMHAVQVYCRIKPDPTGSASCIEVVDDQTLKAVGIRAGSHKEVVKPDGLNGFDVQSESDAIMDRHRLDYQQRLRHPRGETVCASTMKSRSSITVDVPPDALFAVFVSLIEVYNNNVYDLLRETSDLPGKTITTHILREDAKRNVYVSGCVEAEVKNVDDALRIFTTGQKRRRVGQTALNTESSRSHCVFTIRLVRTGYDSKYDEAIENKNLLTVSQLCLVDLAGSERANRAGTQGDRLKEASSINNCLMNLRKCIQVLREIQSSSQSTLGLITPGGSARVVPYRDRRLTHLFKNYFEGNGRVVILVCVRQSVEDYDETLNVLKFAESSQEVSTFRTPAVPVRSPAPWNQTRPHYLQPIRRSARSDDSGDSSTVSYLDDHTSAILKELTNLNGDIDRGLVRLLSNNDVLSVDQDLHLSHIFVDMENLPPTDSDEVSQDSAPEQDRSPCKELHMLKKLDFSPIRALLTQRLDCHQRAAAATEREFVSFRLMLNELLSSDLNPTATASNTSDRIKLDAHILKLEGQIIEKEELMKRERALLVNKVGEYQSEVAYLRNELDRLLTENGRQLKAVRLGPSNSQVGTARIS